MTFHSLLRGLIAPIAVVWCSAAALADYPTPSIYPTSWELKFDHGTPKRIVVDTPENLTPKAYWYLTYTVTNNTDREQTFVPVFEMLTKDGRVSRSDRNIPVKVLEMIRLQEGNKNIEGANQITGTLRIGEAEAKDGVAIWPETNPELGAFSIFVSGLSGETATLVKGKDGGWEKAGNLEDLKPEQRANLIVLHKTLQISYFVRGDAVYPGEDEVNHKSEQWIMR